MRDETKADEGDCGRIGDRRADTAADSVDTAAGSACINGNYRVLQQLMADEMATV